MLSLGSWVGWDQENLIFKEAVGCLKLTYRSDGQGILEKNDFPIWRVYTEWAESSKKGINYYPYGKVLREFRAGVDQERYLSTQHERDAETGLDYRGARYYDADVARFLSLDPLAVKLPSWSPYCYVLGNPVGLIDEDGRYPKKATWVRRTARINRGRQFGAVSSVLYGGFGNVRVGVRARLRTKFANKRKYQNLAPADIGDRTTEITNLDNQTGKVTDYVAGLRKNDQITLVVTYSTGKVLTRTFMADGRKRKINSYDLIERGARITSTTITVTKDPNSRQNRAIRFRQKYRVKQFIPGSSKKHG